MPAICRDCYEVGADVAALFEPWLDRPPGTGARAHLDLAEICRRQLLQAGVGADRIAICGLCTRCRPDEFFSYRRGDRSGRMLSFIGIRP
ncbi:MAG: laccase domain-containing protein [Bryobacteraceae bacterium]